MALGDHFTEEEYLTEILRTKNEVLDTETFDKVVDLTKKFRSTQGRLICYVSEKLITPEQYYDRFITLVRDTLKSYVEVWGLRNTKRFMVTQSLIYVT